MRIQFKEWRTRFAFFPKWVEMEWIWLERYFIRDSLDREGTYYRETKLFTKVTSASLKENKATPPKKEQYKWKGE